MAAVPNNFSVFFHVASSMNTWHGSNEYLYNVNVLGTRNVVDVSLKRNIQKLVLTSGLGVYWSGQSDFLTHKTISEATTKYGASSWIGYTYTKYLQEQEVLDGIKEGQWATILNPVNMIGVYDRNSYGRLYKAVDRGEFPVITTASHNFASAYNVAKAHVNAAKFGRLGENYLLGGEKRDLISFTNVICDALSRSKPVVVPSLLLYPFAIVGDIFGKYVLNKDPEFTLDMWYIFLNEGTTLPNVDSEKAQTELHYQIEFDFEQELTSAARWSVMHK
eukprot:TRINITY_DN7498_c0_g1_i1.p1 TRINITY_DN7498_c0_g1~~TRINITY_DN7498_c0_g1_i1.p1  ORF type:complete len:293 (-),score=75.32 TRINITY_DN7498_c0_g1_i1:121-948(-)